MGVTLRTPPEGPEGTSPATGLEASEVAGVGPRNTLLVLRGDGLRGGHRCFCIRVHLSTSEGDGSPLPLGRGDPATGEEDSEFRAQ